MPVTKWRRAKSWGDYHIAVLLKQQLENEGYQVLLQTLPEWDNVEGQKYDIALVLRGLSRYAPKSNQINLMWNISHPDKVTLKEYEEYDKVFIASAFWVNKIAKQVSVPVEVMLQCTDPERFHLPDETEKQKHHQQLLFVGNSRDVFRKALQDVLPTPFDLAVFGKNWEKIIPKKYIKAKHIKNNQLYKYYGSAEVLLNDHWEDMREKGFVSNRIFDGLASGAFIITDTVKDMGELINFVQVYDTKEQLDEYIQYYLTHPDARIRKSENGMNYIQNHTFKDRAKQFSISIDNLIFAQKNSTKRQAICNICDSTEFKPDPLGRLTKAGDKPHCIECDSLERHRLIRMIWNLLPKTYLEEKQALQFSMGPSVEVEWFSTHEVSIYEQKNSLDLQKIDREDGAYDIVICNQILEHVKDDKTAFLELLRVIKSDGFMQMTVPLPFRKKVTVDWGYPKEDYHGHYRHYGIDLVEYFRQLAPNVHMINIQAADQVTGVEDYVFFWMHSKTTRDYLLDMFKGKVKIERFF